MLAFCESLPAQSGPCVASLREFWPVIQSEESSPGHLFPIQPLIISRTIRLIAEFRLQNGSFSCTYILRPSSVCMRYIYNIYNIYIYLFISIFVPWLLWRWYGFSFIWQNCDLCIRIQTYWRSIFLILKVAIVSICCNPYYINRSYHLLIQFPWVNLVHERKLDCPNHAIVFIYFLKPITTGSSEVCDTLS